MSILRLPHPLPNVQRPVCLRARRILSGNNVSEDGGNRTRRTWKPNAQTATLYSELLDRKVRLKVTSAALRSIDKAGGLDAYVLHSKDAADNALRKQLVESGQ